MNPIFLKLTETSLCLFLFILIGFTVRKIKLLDATSTKTLSTVVARIAQPFLIIYSVIKLSYSPEALKNGLWVLLFGIIAHAVMIFLALLIFAKVKDRDEQKIYRFGFTFCNCAFVGFPILNALFGEIGLFYGAFYVVAYNLAVWSYGVYLMAKGNPDYKLTPLKIFVNSGTVPCILGLALYIARVPFPDFILNVMNTMGGLCTPLSLMVTGSLIAAMPLRKLFLNPKLYAFAGIKLLVFPLLAAFLLHFTGISSLVSEIDIALFLVVMLSLPSAAFTSLFADLYDVKPSYAAQLVSLITILSPFTILAVMKLTELIFTL